MRLSFGTLGLCAWLGDVAALGTLEELNRQGRAASAHIYSYNGAFVIM